MSGEKILFVDDESNLLDGIRNQFHKPFEVWTATSGAEALQILEKNDPPFSVVVSDMRMPQMSGAQFLSAAHEKWPDTVRVLLTGHSDIEDTMKAVNEGNIFRFLTKPCAPEVLAKALDASVAQYRLIRAERDLLENTLKGSIQVLVDILSLINPAAFSRTMRIQHCIRQLVATLDLPDAWSFEVAALLSQIGCVTIPSDTLERVFNGVSLSESEQRMMKDHPGIARNLLVHIPRLEKIAEMIERQEWDYAELRKRSNDERNPSCIGAALLRAVMDYDNLLFSGTRPDQAVERMARKTGVYNPSVLNVLKNIAPPVLKKDIRVERLSNLRDGNILAEDVLTRNGVLIITKGQEVTDLLRRRLENFNANGSIGDTVRIFIR
jgi:CheY-like chemotaxis protein